MGKIKKALFSFGVPNTIITAFLLILFILSVIINIPLGDSVKNVLVRFGMNAVLVLSMVPMIQSGCGLNFGIPVGLISGMLGAVISMELHARGFIGFLTAIVIAAAFALILGYLYGLLLNRVKGDEMVIATYVGFFFIALMNIMWIVLPFKNPASLQGFKGEGLRVTISVKEYWQDALPVIHLENIWKGFSFPVGMLIFFALMALLVYIFFRTKTGTAMTAVGSNPEYARAAGINTDRMRILAVVMSTVIAAIGIIVYEQSFGFVQMYQAPQAFVFPSVAAVLLGGARVNKASIGNVILGTFLFQGILTMTPTVINNMIQIDVSEILRIVITNGLIVYALTRKGRER